MRFIMADEGVRYTPAGHDAQVSSRSIYKDDIDIHTTTFPPGSGMEEEVHEKLSHVFLMLDGSMEILQHETVLKKLRPGDAVYIGAGELHEIRNAENTDAVFLAITFPC